MLENFNELFSSGIFAAAASAVSAFIGSLMTWKWQKRRQEAEAGTAEVQLTKEMQDVYQQMSSDLMSQIDLRRTENENLRSKLDNYENEISRISSRQQEIVKYVYKLERAIISIAPNTCGIENCPKRKTLDIKDNIENGIYDHIDKK